MDAGRLPAAQGRPPRGWPRAAALLGVTLATAVVQPAVLIAIPFVLLVSIFGLRRALTLPAIAVAAVIAVMGTPREGLWYIERAWALIVGGWFAALTLLHPASPASSRALGAVFGATAAGAALLAWGGDWWGWIDWAVSDQMLSGVSRMLDALALMRGEALPPAMVRAIYETADLQASLFPALLALASLAGLGVAWWLYLRVAEGHDQGLGPLRDFRFNDHLVWLFIGGLGMLLAGWGEAFVRAGSNTVVFMGALYALRGAAVVLFLSGGLSLISYMLIGISLLLMPPVILGAAMVVGIGDTWLRFRARVGIRPS